MKTVRTPPRGGQVTDPSADPLEVRAAVGAEIRRRRQALHLSQEQLAARSKVSAIYLGKIENGRSDVGLEILIAIARGLSVPVAHLFGPAPALTSGAIKVGRLYDAVPPELGEAIVGILRASVAGRERKT